MPKYEIDVKIEWTEHREARNKEEALKKVEASFKKDYNINLKNDEIEEIREVK